MTFTRSYKLHIHLHFQSRVEELERLLAEERQKAESSVKERKAKETELLKMKDDLQNQVSDISFDASQ